MKKIMCLALILLMVFSLAACGEDNTLTNDTISTDANTELVDTNENNDLQTDSKENGSDDAEWREFLKEYEEWVDDYIAIVKKQKENPTDMSILTEYSEMLSDLTKWTEKSDDVAKSIKDTEDAIEYSKEVIRIAEKLTKIS